MKRLSSNEPGAGARRIFKGREQTLNSNVNVALSKRKKASELRAEAARLDGIDVPDQWRRAKADELEREANAIVEAGSGRELSPIGEVVPAEEDQEAEGACALADTLRTPDAIAEEASVERTKLLQGKHLDAAALGLDLAKTLRASNAVEKMLAHQAAAVHKAAMKLLNRAMGPNEPEEILPLVNAAARLFDVNQKAVLTLHRLRTGGTQTVKVQHVHVSDGGQAVIGAVRAGLPEGRGREPKVG